MGSIVFFLGILLAVACLEHAGLLSMLAKWLDTAIGRQDIIVIVLGLLMVTGIWTSVMSQLTGVIGSVELPL